MLYAGYTKHVGLDELVPGDLLFYSYKGTISTIHHITIYAGGGMMWEANSKNTGLLYSNIYSVKGLMPFGVKVAVFAWLSSSNARARCCSRVVRTLRALINSLIKSS